MQLFALVTIVKLAPSVFGRVLFVQQVKLLETRVYPRLGSSWLSVSISFGFLVRTLYLGVGVFRVWVELSLSADTLYFSSTERDLAEFVTK